MLRGSSFNPWRFKFQPVEVQVSTRGGLAFDPWRFKFQPWRFSLRPVEVQVSTLEVQVSTLDSSFAHFILKSETLFLPFKFSGNGIECMSIVQTSINLVIFLGFSDF